MTETYIAINTLMITSVAFWQQTCYGRCSAVDYICFFSLFIACCINNNLSVRWRTINSWLLNWMMQFQHRCGVGRAGHVQCVYISLYMCIYSIPELSVYELFWGCAPPPTALRRLHPGASHDTSTGGRDGFRAVLLLQVVPLLLCSRSRVFLLLFRRVYGESWRKEGFLQRVNVPVFITG